MTDERYVARTERLADAQAAHAPVWRSRYDGPYTGLDSDPDPAFAQYAPLLIAAHGGDGVGIWQGGDDLSAALHNAWGAFATTGDPGWAPYAAPGRPAMIFAPEGPRVEADPFAPARAAWSGLTWQPGPWWTTDGAHLTQRQPRRLRLTLAVLARRARRAAACAPRDASCCYLEQLRPDEDSGQLCTSGCTTTVHDLAYRRDHERFLLLSEVGGRLRSRRRTARVESRPSRSA